MVSLALIVGLLIGHLASDESMERQVSLYLAAMLFVAGLERIIGR